MYTLQQCTATIEVTVTAALVKRTLNTVNSFNSATKITIFYHTNYSNRAVI